MKMLPVAFKDGYSKFIEPGTVLRHFVGACLGANMTNFLIGLMLDAISDFDKASFKLDRMRIGLIESLGYMEWNPQITQIYRHACKIPRIKTAPRRLIIATALTAVFSSLAIAQPPPLTSITYRLSMTRPLSHLFEVEIVVELP